MERILTVEKRDDQIAIIDSANTLVGILLNPIEARNVRNQIDAMLKQIEQKDTTQKK